MCTHTDDVPGTTDPWWSVPLPGRYVITGVHIYNRKDGLTDRLSPLDVYVKDGEDDPQLCQSYTESTLDVSVINVECDVPGDVPVTGDMIIVVLPGDSRILTICELVAFGFESP